MVLELFQSKERPSQHLGHGLGFGFKGLGSRVVENVGFGGGAGLSFWLLTTFRVQGGRLGFESRILSAPTCPKPLNSGDTFAALQFLMGFHILGDPSWGPCNWATGPIVALRRSSICLAKLTETTGL